MVSRLCYLSIEKLQFVVTVARIVSRGCRVRWWGDNKDPMILSSLWIYVVSTWGAETCTTVKYAAVESMHTVATRNLVTNYE